MNTEAQRGKFEHHMERSGRQTVHYIKSNFTTLWFVRRPGQTDEEMRNLGNSICQKLNRCQNDETPVIPRPLENDKIYSIRHVKQ